MKAKPALIFLTVIGLFLCSCEKGQAITEEPEIPQEPQTPQEPTIDTIHYLALGDSYTIGHSVSYRSRFPVQLVEQLRASFSDSLYFPEPDIVARTGWTTGNLLSAISNNDTLRSNYQLVSLLIGVNNQYQRQDFGIYEAQFPELLSRAISLAGGDSSRVIVLSIPDYAFTPFGQSRPNPSMISEELDHYNAYNRQIAESRGVAYFDITPVSRKGLEQPALVATDGLHPSGLMYAQWVELLKEYVRRVL